MPIADWFKINRASAEAEPEIVIFGYIGEMYDFWTDEEVGTSAKSFLDQVRALGDVRSLTVRINSSGGSVVDGTAIYGVLSQVRARKTVIIDGFAASMASVIAMAGDVIKMPANAMLMIHDPETFAFGGVDAMDKARGMLERMKASMIAAYRSKNTTMSEAEIAAAMAVETWYTAEDAKVAGFCDEVLEPLHATAMAAKLPESLGSNPIIRFKHPPPALAKAAAEVRAMSPATPEATMTSSQQAQQTASPSEPEVLTAPAAATAAATTAPPPPADNVVPLDEARASARSDALAYSREVMDLCVLAGKPDLATGFIADGKTPADVRTALVGARAAAGPEAIRSHHQAPEGTKANWDKAVAATNARMPGGRR